MYDKPVTFLPRNWGQRSRPHGDAASAADGWRSATTSRDRGGGSGRGGGIFVTARVQKRVDKCIPAHLHSPYAHQTLGQGEGVAVVAAVVERCSWVGGGLQRRRELVERANNNIINYYYDYFFLLLLLLLLLSLYQTWNGGGSNNIQYQ